VAPASLSLPTLLQSTCAQKPLSPCVSVRVLEELPAPVQAEKNGLAGRLQLGLEGLQSN
jgi:hypothetical protein